MTNLQKQLRHLLAFYGHPGIDLDQAVADVERAIEKDELEKLPGAVYTQAGLMTGQEWYDRFEEELPEPYRTARELDPHGRETIEQKHLSYGEKDMRHKAIEAAKKASGLE